MSPYKLDIFIPRYIVRDGNRRSSALQYPLLNYLSRQRWSGQPSVSRTGCALYWSSFRDGARPLNIDDALHPEFRGLAPLSVSWTGSALCFLSLKDGLRSLLLAFKKQVLPSQHDWRALLTVLWMGTAFYWSSFRVELRPLNMGDRLRPRHRGWSPPSTDRALERYFALSARLTGSALSIIYDTLLL